MSTLSIKERFEKLNIEAERTTNEALEKLQEFGKVMVIRPTGFGKTRMLINIGKMYAKNNKNKKVAYIYPIDIIKTEITADEIDATTGKKIPNKYMKDGIIKNKFTFISYMALTRKLNEDNGYWNKFFRNYSLIIVDEVHAAGSDGFQRLYETLQDILGPNGVHMIGATATPDRMTDTEEFNVLDNIFDGIKTYEYTLAHCIRDGLIPNIIMPAPLYDIKQLSEDLKERTKKECSKNGVSFDEKSFNVEIGKLIKGNGTEGEYIYNALPDAGYDLRLSDNKYFKFIVFFVNKEDMIERGPEVENWFNDTFNNVAKDKAGIRRDFTIRSHYIVASDTDDKAIKELVARHKDRDFFTQTKKVENIVEEPYHVDLLFTINKINMGYHVKNITGIMMLRGTKSEIIYYQQLGRALSVTAQYNPIVYDMTNNFKEQFWFKKNRQREITDKILNSIGERGEGVDISDIELIQHGYTDAFDDFMNRWSDIYYSEKAKVQFLYEDRKAPLCVIAQDLNKSCTDIAKILNSMKIQLRPEDAMYNYTAKIYNNDTNAKSKRENAIGIMKYLYSKKASDFYTSVKKATNNLYNKIKKLFSGK